MALIFFYNPKSQKKSHLSGSSFYEKIPWMRFERMTYRLEVAYSPIHKGFQVLLELVRSYYFYYLQACFISQSLPPFARIYQDFCKKVVVLM